MSAPLEAMRETPRYRSLVIAIAAVIGLLLGSVHWLGLLVGGALVGAPAKTTRRALVFGAGFGVLAWAVFAASQFQAGVGPYENAVSLLGLSVAIPVVLGVVGASVRELLP